MASNAVVRNGMVLELTVEGKEIVIGTLEEVFNGQVKVKGATLEAAKAAKTQIDATKKQAAEHSKLAKSIEGIVKSYISYRLVTGFLRTAVKEAEDNVIEQRLLASQLRTTGDAAGYTAEQLSDMAQALQETSRFEAGDILRNITIPLTTFKAIGGTVFKQAQQAVLDMSAAMGSDSPESLKSAAIQLGKALQDPIKGITALARTGVSFSQAQQDLIKSLVESGKLLEAQNIILDEMQGQFGGAAQSAVSGSAKMGVAYKDLAQNLGTILLPAMETAADLISDIADMMGKETPNAYDRATSAAVDQRLEFERLVLTYTRLRSKVNLTTEEHKLYGKTINDLQTKYANYWSKSLDFEKGAWSSISTEISNARTQLQQYLSQKVQMSVLTELEDKLGQAGKLWAIFELQMDEVRGKLSLGLISNDQANADLEKLRNRAAMAEQAFNGLIKMADLVRQKTSQMFALAPSTPGGGGAGGLAGLGGLGDTASDGWERLNEETRKLEENLQNVVTPLMTVDEYFTSIVASKKAITDITDGLINMTGGIQSVTQQTTELTDAQQRQYDMVNSLVGATLDGFAQMVTEGKSFSDAMKDIWRSWVEAAISELNKLIAKMIVTAMWNAALNLMNPASAVASAGTTTIGGGVSGGGLPGPRTFSTGGTSGITMPSAPNNNMAVITELRALRQDVYRAQPRSVQMLFKKGELAYAVDSDNRYRRVL